eukprot:4882087-Pleurochrysis_carterae.AAC.1
MSIASFCRVASLSAAPRSRGSSSAETACGAKPALRSCAEAATSRGVAQGMSVAKAHSCAEMEGLEHRCRCALSTNADAVGARKQMRLEHE